LFFLFFFLLVSQVEDPLALSWISGPTASGFASGGANARHTFTNAAAAFASAAADTAAAAAVSSAAAASDAASGAGIVGEQPAGLVVVEEWERSAAQDEELGCGASGGEGNEDREAGEEEEEECEEEEGEEKAAESAGGGVSQGTATAAGEQVPATMDAATLMRHVEAMAAEVTRTFESEPVVAEDRGGEEEGEGVIPEAGNIGEGAEDGAAAAGAVAGEDSHAGSDNDAGDDFEGMD
jgi:hypothetical protein